MVVPGAIFEMIKKHSPELYSGAGSVLCSLTNPGTHISLGVGALLPPTDPSYDADDELRGIPSFTGATYDPETGLLISVDTAEIAISQSAITIGRPLKGWKGKMRNLDDSDLDFHVLDVMQDRTVGLYRMRLEILKEAGKGRRIDRSGEGGV